MKIKTTSLKALLLCFSFFAFLYSAEAQAPKKHDFKVSKEVKYASPGGFDLTMDIYTPATGKERYPVLVIIHGGGWLINNKSIMDEMSAYMASNGQYVVCNINYRLLGDQGNTVTVNQIVEDVFGAVLWVKDNIAQYGGNPNAIAVTGDSAGGHLAEMVVVAGHKLASHRFEKQPYGFKPSYLPAGKTAEDVAAANGLAVQAAIPSYGAFDLLVAAMGSFEKDSNFFWQMGGAKARGIFGSQYNATDNADMYKAVSPIYLIPEAAERKLPPQFFHVGSTDQTTPPAAVKAYVDQLIAKGQHAEYWLYEGRNHAYLDSGSNQYLGVSFEKDAITALDKMIAFLDGVFY